MKINNVLAIYNPAAGKNMAGKILHNTIKQLLPENCRLTIHTTQASISAEDIILAEKEDYDLIICCGGDGTLNQTLNGIMNRNKDKKPFLCYVPAGSTNDFAFSMGIGKNALADDCENISQKDLFSCDIGKFNQRYFNYVAAFGAFTGASYSAPQELKNTLGHIAYLVEGIRHVPIGRSHKVTVCTGKEKFSGNYIFGSVSNSTRLGGFILPGQANVVLDDGLFEVILIEAPRNLIELQNILGALITQNFNTPQIKLFKTERISFLFEEETAWTLDGEFGGLVQNVYVDIIPRAIDLLK